MSLLRKLELDDGTPSNPAISFVNDVNQNNGLTRVDISDTITRLTNGLTIDNNQSINFGTSGVTNMFNLYGYMDVHGSTALFGVGSSNIADSTLYVSPNITNSTNASYYFSSFDIPTLTSVSGTTVPNAYTMYIAGSPIQSGLTTITNSYALYIASGVSRVQDLTVGGTLTLTYGLNINNGQTF